MSIHTLAPCILLATLPMVFTSAQDSPAAPEREAEYETITREGDGGVTITADRYAAKMGSSFFGSPTPIIVCLHMARSSRGEYRESAPIFTELGMEVLAVDMRSGGKRFDVQNETAAAAKELGVKQEFDDAYVDIEAAVAWARELAPRSPVFLMGSSYTSSLSLRYASENPDKIDAVLAFSPGNYRDGWKIDEKVKKLKIPAFITWGSGDREERTAKAIVDAVPAKLLTSYDPADADKAEHGSRMLASKNEKARETHWKAVREFLITVKPVAKKK